MPLLDEALVGLAVCGNIKPGGVEDQPQQTEIGKRLPLEHPLQVKLHKRLPGHADVVTHQPQLPAVGGDGPERFLSAIDVFLYQRVGGGAAGPCHPRGAPVERNIGPHQMDRQMVPLMGNRKARLIDRAGGGGCSQRAVAQLLKEVAQPELVGWGGGGVGGGRLRQLVSKALVDVEQPRPATGDRFAQPFILS